jgi:hypothetical protein
LHNPGPYACINLTGQLNGSAFRSAVRSRITRFRFRQENYMNSLFSSVGNVFGGLLSLIWLIIVILAIISVTKSGAGTLAKVFWIIVLVFFPLVGLIIWYLFGPRSS